MNFKALRRFTQALCVLTTIVLSCLCFHKFFLDEDLAQVNFQTFNDNKHAIYPTITLCFMGPYIFVERKFKGLGEGINGRNYSNFLQGLTWDDEMREIDFDNVTLNIEDYLEGVIISSSGDTAQLCSTNFQKILKNFSVPGCVVNETHQSFSPNTFKFYISYRDYQTKCFSMDIPFEKGRKLNRLRVFIRSEVFPRTLDKEYMFEKNFGVFLHYPKQLFRSPIQKLYQKVENDSLLQVIKFKMQNMEVLLRRNKPNKRCNEDWNKDDDKILCKIIRAIGCYPPYWKTPQYAMRDKLSNVEGCSDKSKMQIFSRHLPLGYLIPNVDFLNNLSPPCQDVTQILYEYAESEWNKEEFKGLDVQAKFFEVNLAFPSKVYKEIVQVRAYGVQSLVGYVGGYIGMFLGLGLLQVPALLTKAVRKIKASKSKTNVSEKCRKTTKRSKYIENVSTKSVNQPDEPQQCVECPAVSNETNRKLEACELAINHVSDSLLNSKADILEKEAKHKNCTTTTDTQTLQKRISNIEDKVDCLCDSMHKMRNKDLIFV